MSFKLVFILTCFTSMFLLSLLDHKPLKAVIVPKTKGNKIHLLSIMAVIGCWIWCALSYSNDNQTLVLKEKGEIIYLNDLNKAKVQTSSGKIINGHLTKEDEGYQIGEIVEVTKENEGPYLGLYREKSVLINKIKE